MADTSFFGDRRSGVIFAADLDTPEENFRVLDLIAEEIDVIKVASPLIYRHGTSVIGELIRRFDLPVFADLKIADVPHTDARIVELLADEGASAAMIHGFVGVDAIEACQIAAAGRLGLIMQLELTNPGGKTFTAPLADDFAALAASLELFGVQAPGNRPERIKRIREIVGSEPVLVCCGVGVQGGSHREVVEAGGTYSIIGRSIYRSENPLAALRGLVREEVSP